MKYTKNDLLRYVSKRDEAETELEVLTNRVDYIVHLICKTFGTHPKYWYFSNAEEGQTGTPDDSSLESDHEYDEFSFCLETGKEICIKDLWDYNEGFPRAFLFMSDKDIVSYIEAQFKEQEEINKKAKEKRNKRVKEKENVRKKALAKLTKEERAELGL